MSQNLSFVRQRGPDLRRSALRLGCAFRGGLHARVLFHGTVDHVLQFFAGLEERNLLGGNVHAVPGLGIAADAGFTLARAEAAESPNLDLIASAQRAHHALEDGLYNDLAVLPSEFRQPGNFIDQVCLGHLARPLSRNNRLPTSTTDTLRFAAGLASLSFRWTSLFS